MIDRQQLLKNLQRLLPKMEKDILVYSECNPEIFNHLNDEYSKSIYANITS